MSRVLIVEDRVEERRALGRVLRRAGHEVTEAGSVDEAERLLSAVRFDVVLLDLFMPGRSGDQLLPMIEKLEPQPGVAVVSGNLDAARSAALCAWGRVMPLSKPVPPEVLRQAVETLAAPADGAVVRGFAALVELSPRETEVLQLLYAKHSAETIAAQIACKPSTVRTYFQRIERKTGCHSLAEVLASLAQFAARRITPPRGSPPVR